MSNDPLMQLGINMVEDFYSNLGKKRKKIQKVILKAKELKEKTESYQTLENVLNE